MIISGTVAEEIISQLSRLNPSRLGVIARSSSIMFKRLDGLARAPAYVECAKDLLCGKGATPL
jgi:TolB-like protein